MTEFLAVLHTAGIALTVTSAMGLIAAMAMWREHTPESRLLAEDISAALDVVGPKHGSLAAIIFDAKESTALPRLSRALSIGEPLNIYRLAVLGPEFWIAFCTRVIRRYGGEVFTPEQVALLRGAARVRPRPIRMKVSA